MVTKLMASACLLALSSTLVFAEKDKAPASAPAQQSERLAFGDVDSNHDMKITEDELKAKFKNVAKFKKADTNNDGTLDKEEYIAYATEERQSQP